MQMGCLSCMTSPRPSSTEAAVVERGCFPKGHDATWMRAGTPHSAWRDCRVVAVKCKHRPPPQLGMEVDPPAASLSASETHAQRNRLLSMLLMQPSWDHRGQPVNTAVLDSGAEQQMQSFDSKQRPASAASGRGWTRHVVSLCTCWPCICLPWRWLPSMCTSLPPAVWFTVPKRTAWLLLGTSDFPPPQDDLKHDTRNNDTTRSSTGQELARDMLPGTPAV